ncbi:MAG: hypothetical protein ACRDD7_11185 [Peptostreptococcaceae bacterium]
MNKNLYGSNTCGIVKLTNIKTKDGIDREDYILDYANEIFVRDSSEGCIVIISTDLMDDELRNIDRVTVIVENAVRNFTDLKTHIVKNTYDNYLRNVLIVSDTYSNNISKYYICYATDSIRSSVVNKELNKILDRNNTFANKVINNGLDEAIKTVKLNVKIGEPIEVSENEIQIPITGDGCKLYITATKNDDGTWNLKKKDKK